MKKVGLFLISLVSGSLANGHLLIIGGGSRPEKAMREFVRCSQAKSILVITSASDIPNVSGPAVVKELTQCGAQHCSWIHIDSPAAANRDSVVNLINSSGGLFFCGGVQSRFMDRIANTRTHQALLEFYQRGGIIGGTSAGAAVLSDMMITGEEKLNADSTNTFGVLLKDNIVTRKGLGLVKKAIIDQHFVLRRRHNRLLSLVLQHPQLLGIGIDENTAILVQPDGHFTVFGSGWVFIYDARKGAGKIRSDQGRLSGRDIRLQVLTEGQHGKMN